MIHKNQFLKGAILLMGIVIPFKTREQLEQEKKQQVLDDWLEYVDWEHKAIAAACDLHNSNDLPSGLSKKDILWLQGWLKQGFKE